MESSGCQVNQECCNADRRSGWGWLAAAALAGVMVARGHRRGGVALGLGLALWKCCGERSCDASRGPKVDEVADEEEALSKPPEEVVEEEEAQGGWLLNLEPVPLVVREDVTPASGQGQGDDLLGQGPGQAVEVLDWQAPEGTEALWMNEGAEIPDTVELPELGEGTGSSPAKSEGV